MTNTARRLGLAVLTFALVACGAPAPATPPATTTSVTSSLDPTTRAFVELTIATDDQAVKLLDLGARGAASAALRTFAGEVAAARRTELAALHDILGSIPYVNNHAGHDMPGMPTEAELIALRASADFDTDFVRLVRNHLTESTTVARSGAEAITEPRTQALATSMVRQRGEELPRLDTLA